MAKVDSKSAREKLPQRREPYWHKLRSGAYLGFRRGSTGGTWIVRLHVFKGHRYESLGPMEEVPLSEQFDEAVKRANDWLATQGAATPTGYNVKRCVDDYVSHREINNSSASAKDAMRLYKHLGAIADIRLSKLTQANLKDWHHSMVRLTGDPKDMRRSKDTANRSLSYLKAALNLALRKDMIGSDKAWRLVDAFENVGEARKVYLTEAQLQRVLEVMPDDFRDLCKSAILTGARYGELCTPIVEDLDTRHGTLRVSGKTGTREIVLSDEALQHFKTLAQNKTPKAYLHLKADGQPWTKSTQCRPMTAAVIAAKLPRESTFYAFRHTYISRALLAGINIQVIAENCGTSIRMIEKHYGKFRQADRRDMFNRLKMI